MTTSRTQALTEKQLRVLEHYNFSQFDEANLANVPHAVRRDLWAMLDEMSTSPPAPADGKDAARLDWLEASIPNYGDSTMVMRISTDCIGIGPFEGSTLRAAIDATMAKDY